MDFLIDASMPRSAAPLVGSLSHNAVDVRDIGMTSATDDAIAAHAQTHQQAIISRDFDFADVRNYPPELYHGIVVIDLPCTATVPTILSLLSAFFQSGTLKDLPGRLAIVEPGRIRLRPAP